VPKPYDFVPIAAPRKEKTVGHERILGDGYASGRLTYDLRALTPVFVASGSYALGKDVGHQDTPVVRACYRVKGVPAIPGSSLKGVIRSIAEAVSRVRREAQNLVLKKHQARHGSGVRG